MVNRWGKSINSNWLYFLGLQNHCGQWLQPWNKRRLLLGRKAMTNLDSVFKSRNITLPTEVCTVKSMAFPVVTYGCELDHREGWAPKNWCLWTAVLENTLESTLENKENKPVNPKGLNIHWKDWCWCSNTLATWCREWRDSLEKILMLGKTEGRRRQQRKMAGWHHWLNGLKVWIWANFGR